MKDDFEVQINNAVWKAIEEFAGMQDQQG